MFWERFVSLCAETGEAPNTVAAKCGVKSSGTVTGWSKGAKPRFPIAKKIAEYFGTTVAYLVGEDSDKNGSPSHWANLADPANDEMIDAMTGQKETPVTESDGLIMDPIQKLNDRDMRLLMWFRSLPPEKQKAILISQDAPSDLV